jgi:carbon-monoxide dehydrogenase medium subunit
MRAGSINADYIINIQKIPALSYFKYDENVGLEFGAMTTLQFLDTSKELKRAYPILQQAIHQITSVQSKYMGTAVGNICVATPASDVSPALMAYDAELIIAGVGGTRRENINNFYVAYQKTTLKRGELVVGVSIPKAAKGTTGAAFMNRVRTHADIAKITVSVVVEVENDICTEARIAIGSVAPTAVRAVKAETLLRNKKISTEIIQLASEYAMECANPITDIRSTQEYRTEMIRVLVGRALEKAFKRARGLRDE